jgi:5-methylthioadenosine/S-adenosylhomocysteine deaminase
LKEHPCEEVLDFGESVILPGLVNCHTHLRDTLWRGTIDNHNFISWAKAWVNISHKMPRRLTIQELQNSCRIGLCEAIRSGTACIADVSSHGVSLKPLIESKIRGICFIEAHDQIGTLVPEARSPKKETENVLEETRKDVMNAVRTCKNTLVNVGVGPHAPYSASSDLIKGIAKMAREMKLRLGIHLSECREEVRFIENGEGVFAENARRVGIEWAPKHMSPVEYLASLNFLGVDVLAAHCVHINNRDIDILAEKKVGVAHNPISNAKLANGVAPLLKMLEKGVKVGLGTDGAQTNNSLNMFETMKFAVLLQRALHEEPVLNAHKILRLATIDGAKALGFDHLIGSIEPGKKADLIAVNLESSEAGPTYDPVSTLVFTSAGSHVEFVMVDGEVLMEDGRILSLDEENALKEMEKIRGLIEVDDGE